MPIHLRLLPVTVASDVLCSSRAGCSLRVRIAGFLVLAVGQAVSSMQCYSSRAAVQDEEHPGQGLAANQANSNPPQPKCMTIVTAVHAALGKS